MKSLFLAIVFVLFLTFPVFAQETTTTTASPTPSPSSVLGLYDEDITSTNSASVSASPTPTASPSARATTYLDPTNTPVAGATENSLLLLALGVATMVLGIFYSYQHKGLL